MRSNLIQTKITISGIKASGYKTPNGDWVMGIRDVSRMVDKSPSSLSDFLQSKWLKHKLGEAFTCPQIDVPNSPPIKVIPIPIISLFIKRQALKGNEVADNLLDALLSQSLELRLEASLPTAPAEVKKAVNCAVSKHENVRTLRDEHKEVHRSFDLWMQA